MSFSYSGIVNYGKATLPSVDSWGTNMNILRDPPKMVMTRKIDKVGETSSLTQMVDESGDRMCEIINTYARGVNPFVAVSYSNASNNGGQRVNGSSTLSNPGQQASLPYKIGGSSIGGGSFRPPIVPPQSLLPLSRLPRTNTSQFTQPGFADFTKKMLCPQNADHTKGVKNDKDVIRTFIRPTAVYQIETPLVEPFEVKYVIKNPIKTAQVGGGISGIKTMDITQQHVSEPYKNIIENPLHAKARVNIGSSLTVRHSNNNTKNTDKYIQDTLHSDVRTQLTRDIQALTVDQTNVTDVRTKDALNITYNTPMKGHEKQEFIHGNIELERTLPHHSSRTNHNQNIYIRPEIEHQKELKMNRPTTQGFTNQGSSFQKFDISSREYQLKPTINPGGFEGKGSTFGQNRGTEIPNIDSNKSTMSRKIMEMQMGRY